MIQLLVVSFTLLGCVAWAIALVITVAGMRRVRLLSDIKSEPPATWPRVSAIIPACNEADHMKMAFYPTDMLRSGQRVRFP